MPVMNMFPGGSTLQIPLDAPTSFSATAGNAQVELTWTDPLDKYATPEGEVSETGDQLVSEWNHTVLVRKTGSQPAGPNDGTVVVSSSVRNQYQTTAYVDSGLTNDTTYYYGVFAYNKDGVASGGAFTNATPTASIPINELALGTLIKINENGAPIEYMVVNQGRPSNLYDASCDGCWVVRKDIYAQNRWDNGASGYGNSEIASFLKNTFMNVFSQSIKNVIKQVKIPYQNYAGSDGDVESGADGLECHAFAPSAFELGLTKNNQSSLPQDGARLDYYSSGAGTEAVAKRIAQYNGENAGYWTRSPDAYQNTIFYSITSAGGLRRSVWSDVFGIRPFMIIDSGAMVDGGLNLIGA